MPRYSDARILEELTACAGRLGRSPTMREFRGDPEVRVHPQTVVERFGTWNAAKRRAGLVPRRFATDAELLSQLRDLGAELGRVPTGRDLDERRARLSSKSLYWHRFGSFSNAFARRWVRTFDALRRFPFIRTLPSHLFSTPSLGARSTATR